MSNSETNQCIVDASRQPLYLLVHLPKTPLGNSLPLSSLTILIPSLATTSVVVTVPIDQLMFVPVHLQESKARINDALAFAFASKSVNICHVYPPFASSSICWGWYATNVPDESASDSTFNSANETVKGEGLFPAVPFTTLNVPVPALSGTSTTIWVFDQEIVWLAIAEKKLEPPSLASANSTVLLPWVEPKPLPLIVNCVFVPALSTVGEKPEMEGANLFAMSPLGITLNGWIIM